MKLLRLATTLGCLLVLQWPVHAIAQTSSPGLVAAYGFDQGSGSSVTDASGNGHTGTISGATWTTQGKFGGALAFNGTNNWVTVASTSLLNLTSAMTLEAWVLPTATSGTRDVLVKEGTNVDIYNLYARNWRGLPEANAYIGGSNRTAEGVTLPSNTWTHLAGTYDGTTVRLFVNGTQVASAAISGTIATSSGPLSIGGNSLWGEYFQGSIDEVRVYNRALTATEIQTDMNSPLGAANPTIPVVTITGPASDAQLSGMVTITANAADDLGIAGVTFLVDGTEVGPEDTEAPFAISWDTSTAAVGAHVLTARARDTTGNIAVSAAVSVQVLANPLPGQFVDEVVVSGGLTFPTAFEFLPDGRMLITEFQGRILVVQAGANVVDPTPVITIPNFFNEDVTVGGERGLVNVIADPDFVQNGYIYAFYTAAVPQRDRVARFTMSGNTAAPGSEFVVWQGQAASSSTDHHGGGLAFGPDGKLYISTGDNGDPASCQSLTSDHGKIIRLNKDGTVPADNPFVDGAGPNIDGIWARGLRNPYRFSFDTTNGRMYIGDVGQNTVEEVNVGAAGANYGWPVCEGACSTAGMRNPIYQYSHDGRDSAITGGFVYRGAQFPASFAGAYFYGDFALNVIRYLTLDAAGNVTGNTNFLPPDGAPDGPFDPVMLKQAPDGSLVYVDFGWGWQESVNPASIRRIRFVSGNLPPVVQIAASPMAGPPPLNVAFSSSGSFDPEGQALSHIWTFGDGTTSIDPNPQHSYGQSGVYRARLQLSDGVMQALSDELLIKVGTPPVVEITSPSNGFVFSAGDVVRFSGTASDAADGPLPPSALTWTILFHHDTHVHPTFGPASGQTEGTFTIPITGHDFAGSTSYEIILTATNAAGLQTTKSVFLYPNKVDLTFVTDPVGFTMIIDGVTKATPFVMDTLSGFRHAISVVEQAIGGVTYGFVSWSDGGAQSHQIIAGDGPSTYTALFQVTSVGIFPAQTSLLAGTLASGSPAELVVDDNVYYSVNSTRSGTRTTSWYGSFSDVPNGITGLRIRYRGSNSRNCTQTVGAWNWVQSAWVQLDSRTVGTAEVEVNVATLPGTLADYVSGTTGNGEVRVRVNCQTTANFTSRGDLLSVVYEAPVGPPPPDTTPPFRSNGSPSGVLSGGRTNATLGLTTDEHAECRYSTQAGQTFPSMITTFATTGTTTHSTVVNGLQDGGSYAFYVRCRDFFGNASIDDYVIQFSIAQGGAQGLVAAYGFDQGSGSSVTDASGNGHTGTISGATWTTQGKFGGALAFNGTNNWVTVASTSLLNLTSAMTLEAWVLPTATSGTRDVLVKEGTNVDIYNLYARNWRGRPEANAYIGGSNRTAEGVTLPSNTWTHLAGTYDGTTVRLFVNGTQVASAAISGTIATSSGPLSIGGNSLWGEYFQGSIDEVRVYNRALTATEIQTDMNSPIVQ